MSKTTKCLFILLLFAGALRAALLIYAAQHPARFDFPDSHRYVTVARNIAAGYGPIQARDVLAGTDPAYPGVLALGIYLGCESTSAIMNFGRVVNALAGLATVSLCWMLGWQLFNERVGWLAASWCAVDPILLFFNALVLTELPFIALMLAGLYCVVRWRGSSEAQWAWLAGALFGIGALMRSSSVFLFVPYVLLLLSPNVGLGAKPIAPRKHRMRAGSLFLFGMLLVMGPTIYRNFQLFDAFVPVRTGSGASLLEAWGPWADGGPGMEKIEYPPTPVDANELQRDLIYRDAAVRWARENPSSVLELALIKLGRTWSITMNAAGYQTGFYAIVCGLSVTPIFILALIGCVIQRKQRWITAFLLAPAAYFTLIHMVFVGSVRYRLPAMPLLFILAATAVDRWLRRRDDSKTIESA